MQFLGLAVQFGNFLSDQWRSLWMAFDIVIYKILSFLHKLFIYICEVDLLDNAKVNEIYRRIWLLLGLFMLFLLAFSLIQMLVDPDKMTDKSKGISKLIFRVLVSVVLLVTIGTIFSEAKDVQKMLLSFDRNTNVVAKLLDLDDYASDIQANNSSYVGIHFAQNVFFTFFKESKDSNGNFESTPIYGEGSISNIISSENSFDYLSQVVNDKNKDTKEYYFNYTWFISTVTGGFLCWIYINYCIAVGVRVFQLAYLQLIAPIPIFSYISEKGQTTFKKWVSQCVTTYVDIFLRVLIIYLSIYLVNVIQMAETNSFNISFIADDPDMVGWVKIVLIIAVLMFAKKAPELIKELFPSTSKASGDLGLNLRKNLKGMLGYGAVAGVMRSGATLGKKTVAGLDALANGENFGTGWSKIQGKGPLNKLKTGLNSMMPFSAQASNDARNKAAEARKNKESVQAAYNKNQELINKGKEIFNKNNGQLKDDSFKSKEYFESYKELSVAKTKLKSANNNLELSRAELQGAYSSGDSKLIENKTLVYQAAAKQATAAQNELDYRKTHHENMRKMYTEDAFVEDAFVAYQNYQKYNNSSQNNGVSSSQQSIENVNGPRPIDITGGSLNNGGSSSGRTSI